MTCSICPGLASISGSSGCEGKGEAHLFAEEVGKEPGDPANDTVYVERFGPGFLVPADGEELVGEPSPPRWRCRR